MNETKKSLTNRIINYLSTFNCQSSIANAKDGPVKMVPSTVNFASQKHRDFIMPAKTMGNEFIWQNPGDDDQRVNSQTKYNLKSNGKGLNHITETHEKID